CLRSRTILIRIVNLSFVIVIENQFLFPPIAWFPIQVGSDQPFLGQQIVQRSRRENGIRAPGVAQRVGDQTPDPYLLVQRQADVRHQIAVAILIVRSRVVGIDATGADRIIEDVELTVAGDCLAKSVIGSAFLANRYSGWSAPLFRKNLDHARERTWTVDRALRTAGDFDSADVVRREV